MLRKFGGLTEYEGEPGFLYGEKLFISADGHIWTGCMESYVFTRYAAIEGAPRIYKGLKVLDRVLVNSKLDVREKYGYINDVIQKSRKVTVSGEYNKSLICTSMEARSTNFMWWSGGADKKSTFAYPLHLYDVSVADVFLLEVATRTLQLGLPRPVRPVGIQERMHELSRKFDLFLLAWLKREMKNRGAKNAECAAS